MRRTIRAFAFIWLAAATLTGCHPERRPAPKVDPDLRWAYPQAAKSSIPDPGPVPYRVPGSKVTYSRAQVAADGLMLDWYPDEHPSPPPVISKGVNGSIPCGACHLPNGVGFLAAPDLASLPPAYIAEQIRAFRSGDRVSAEKGRPATQEMIETAKKVDDRNALAAATYYAAIARFPRYRVVETDMVPATKPNHYGWLDLVPGAPEEPIGDRIVEVPEDTRRMFISDDRTHVIDYVPRGAIADGAALVRSGGPGGQACTSCHGSDLRGTGGTPPLAGRSAAYLARQLWDIKTGARGGASVALMQNVTAKLTPRQIRDIAAYLASRAP